MQSLFQKNIHTYGLLLALPLAAAFLTGCEQPIKARQYKEVLIESQQEPGVSKEDPHALMGNMPQDEIHRNLNIGDKELQGRLNQSVAPASLSWATPDNWLEKKETGGMRVASFASTDKAYPIEATIVSLAGAAGGVAANVTRWLQQLKLTVPSMEELESFINQQERIKTPSGLEAVLIDFTKRQKEAEPQAPSMIAAIIEREGSQIFVKMTGSKEAVLNNTDSFRSLVLSIQVLGP
ncbi:MAG: hypothetical protein Q7S13_02760 [Candidatus Omnitrophota bacterium]|nr:hypothetical protein [Candidatus Omnitrophota bacterium]